MMPSVADQLTRAVRLLSPPHLVVVAGVQNTEIAALANQVARDWLDPWVSLAAQEHEAARESHSVLLRRLGAPVVCAREELLEHAVLAQYEALRRTRRVESGVIGDCGAIGGQRACRRSGDTSHPRSSAIISSQ